MAPRSICSSAFLHQQALSVAQIEVGRENQRNPPAQAPAGAPGYPGVLIADAMHTQRETARFRVEADSLFIAKNQKSIREDIAALGHDDFSPCIHSAIKHMAAWRPARSSSQAL